MCERFGLDFQNKSINPAIDWRASPASIQLDNFAIHQCRCRIGGASSSIHPVRKQENAQAIPNRTYGRRHLRMRTRFRAISPFDRAECTISTRHRIASGALTGQGINAYDVLAHQARALRILGS